MLKTLAMFSGNLRGEGAGLSLSEHCLTSARCHTYTEIAVPATFAQLCGPGGSQPSTFS